MLLPSRQLLCPMRRLAPSCSESHNAMCVKDILAISDVLGKYWFKLESCKRNLMFFLCVIIITKRWALLCASIQPPALFSQCQASCCVLDIPNPILSTCMCMGPCCISQPFFP